MNEASVLGLGSMGACIARLFIDSKRDVTVWNRSAGKTQVLVELGATAAADVASAIRASRIVVMCVYDYAAAEAILAAPGVAAAIQGRILVQLTTGSPEDSRRAHAWATQHGAAYLDGAIQAAPSQMGQADTPILISGDAAAYDAARPFLNNLAGNLIYLGEKIDAAATMDLATLSYVYGAMAGFLHGARLAETAGLDVAHYGRIVRDISPSFGEFFAHEASVIHSGDFTITESPMRISVEATRRILDSSTNVGLQTEIPALFANLLQRADTAGLGDEELAALIKVLR